MKRIIPVLFAILFYSLPANAQTTINTSVGTITYLSGSSGVTFVVQNTNSYAVTLTDVSMYRNTASTSATYTLWYSATSLSGSGTVQTPTWTQITQVSPGNVSSSAVHPIFSGLSFTIPASTTYRFCVQSSNRTDYGSSGTNTASNGGINVFTGNYTISGNVGYAGSGSTISLANNPRYFYGSVTFAPACNAPTGVAASGITASSATISWNAVSSSQGYEYVLDQSSASPGGSGTAYSSTTLNLSGLTQNTGYYIHVRNKCSSTSFSGWVNVPFTTMTSCFPPASVTVNNLTSSTGKLNWTTVSGSLGYEYKIDQSSGNPTSGWSTATGNSISFTGLTGGANYYAHVRNLCSGGDKSSWVNTPFTMPECFKPVNVLLSNITDSSADVLWSQMANAVHYEYAVDFSNLNPVSGIKTTTGINTHLGGLMANSKYYIHVRSRCFTSDSSDWRLDSFTTKMVCYAPAVQVNYLGTNTPYAYWDNIPTAIAYEYALTHTSSKPPFGTEIYNTYINLTLPEDGKDYYLHVRAKCNSQFTVSKWSTVTLRTGTTGISRIDDYAITIAPNPVKDMLNISGAAGMYYTITSLSGQVLTQGTATNDTWLVNTTSLPAGIYLLQLNKNPMKKTMRFIKQ